MTAITFDLLANAARWADRTAARTRTIQCPECGGDGRISYSHMNDPSPKYCGVCPDCGGSGEVEREIEEPNL